MKSDSWKYFSHSRCAKQFGEVNGIVGTVAGFWQENASLFPQEWCPGKQSGTPSAFWRAPILRNEYAAGERERESLQLRWNITRAHCGKPNLFHGESES